MRDRIEYDPALIEEIADWLETGQPLSVKLREISDRLGKKLHRRTLHRWRTLHPEAGEALAEAEKFGEEAILDDIHETAITPQIGQIEKLERVPIRIDPGTDRDRPLEFEMVVTEIRREDMTAHRKLKIDGLDKLLAKKNPKRFGTNARLELTGKDGKDLIPATPPPGVDWLGYPIAKPEGDQPV